MMKDLLAPLLLAATALAGGGLAFQAVVNGRMRDFLAHPIHAALASFVIGTAALAVAAAVALAIGAPRPSLARVAQAPWWVWLGGLLGAYYILTTVTILPRVGATVFLAVVVAGQLAAAIAIDHTGAFGVERHPVSAGRIAGGVLLVLGVLLVRRF